MPINALEQAWEHYGGRLPSRGNKAHCPLHEDHTASATVDLETGRWRCYAGCGWGDIYHLIKLAEKVDFPTAKRIAEEKFGAEAPVQRNKKRPGRKGSWVPPWLR